MSNSCVLWQRLEPPRAKGMACKEVACDKGEGCRLEWALARCCLVHQWFASALQSKHLLYLTMAKSEDACQSYYRQSTVFAKMGCIAMIRSLHG